MNTYHHLVERVEYPMERGYRMESCPLSPWIHLTVSENKETGSKQLTVHSRIHMDKEVKVGPSYSSSFSDQELIKDMSGEISSRFT